MKHFLTLLFILTASLGVIHCTPKTENAFPLLDEGTQKSIIQDLSIALNKMAEASIPIGGDTETSWAASVVDSLHNVITEQDLPFLEKMTRIYEMNGLFAYGMNYAISIYGLYVCPEEAGFAYHSMPVCDSLVNKAASSGYNDIMEIADLSAHTYFYNQLYLTILNKLNQNDDFNDRDLGFPLQALGMLRDVKSRGKYSDSDLIKMFFALDAVSFFKTFCPLTVNFTYTEEQYNLNRTKIVEYATYIDSVSSKAFNVVYSETDEPLEISDKEFEEFMIKTTAIKVDMMNLLTAEFIEGVKRNKDNAQ